MQITVRTDSIEIEGYVNSIERLSKPLFSRIGRFLERIKKGAFARALKRNDNVRILLNHDWGKDLGGTKDGNLELVEDAIGLKARATITDPEVVEKGKRGDLIGWSFGFSDIDVDLHDENGMPTRDVKDLELYEVSLLDRTKVPAYDGTLVTLRSEEEVHYYGEAMLDEIEIREIEESQEEDVVEETAPEEISEETTEEETMTRDESEEPKQHESVDELKFDFTPYEEKLKKMKEDA